MTVAVAGTADSAGLLEAFACGAFGACDPGVLVAGAFASPASLLALWPVADACVLGAFFGAEVEGFADGLV